MSWPPTQDPAPMGRWHALAARCLNPGQEELCPPWLRNALFVLFLAGILAYGFGFAWHMLARFDLINLISNTHDDAFYYFQIARNLAEGSSRPSTAASRAPTDITRSGCF